MTPKANAASNVTEENDHASPAANIIFSTREMNMTTSQNDHLPGLLRLPFELRNRILLDVLSEGTSSCVPSFFKSVDGFPLCQRATLTVNAFIEEHIAKNSHGASVCGILFSCRSLHEDCLELLAERFMFIIQTNVRDDAPTGANAFHMVHALDSVFRSRTKRIAIPVTFLVPHPDGHFDSSKFCTMFDPDRNTLMFEKIIENVNELLHLMPGVERVHMVWNMFFGNGGLAMVKERYTRQIWERLRKEWPGRQIKWSAQTCMGVFNNR